MEDFLGGFVNGVKLHDAWTFSEYSLNLLVHQMEDGDIIESRVNVFLQY